MMKGTRVASTPDVSRIAAAVRSPGIDPRTWVCYAHVTAVHLDPDEGVFVDVMLMPSRQATTARVGCEYAGPSYGTHFPIGVDDEILVSAPSGDPDHGLVVLRRLHSPSDPPPQDVVDNPDDVVIVIKPGQSFRVVVAQGGDVVIAARDDGQVLLGDPDSTSPIARVGDDVRANAAALQAMLDARYQLGAGAPLTSGVIASISSGSDKVRAS